MLNAPGRAIRLRASAAVVRNGKILLVPHYGGDGSVRWYLPGGKVEWLEPLEEAAIREFKEETGFDVKLTGLLDVAQNITDEPWHSVSVIFSGAIIGGVLQAERNQYTAYGDKTPRWFNRESLPDVVAYLLPAVKKAYSTC